MKLTRVSTIVVGAEMRNWVFVKLETDEGVTGWGEATVEWKTRAVTACVEDLASLLIGEDPRRVEHLFQIMVRQHFFRPGMVESSAISGVEQACWDILGKSLGVPVWQLLGGNVRDHVRLYDHLGGGEMESVYHSMSAERAAEKAIESLEAGFDAIKLEVVIPRTAPLDGSEALHHADSVMAAVREAVGEETELMVDLHGRASPQMAAQYFRVLEPYRPWFFEEACPADQPRAMAELARRTWVPLAAGERLSLRKPFHELLELGAVSVLQPDLVHCGGIGEARRIAALGEVYGAVVAPHSSTGPIGHAASVHLGFATPNFIIQETWRADVPWRFEVLTEQLDLADGVAKLPTKPGLGIAVDEREAAKHPFEQEPLMRYFHPDGSVADW
ncbi:MAG TPA: galactonate dehydratase [Solirubrobacteraceae bacterium]|nr:galactonate dehydratase [Solirubrobacteraceae bacterium]